MQKINLTAKAGARTSLTTGMLENGFCDRMVTPHFYKAENGSTLHLLNADYSYAVASYSMEFDAEYIYTYSYQPEENWTTYLQDLTPDSYMQEDYTFADERYFRVCLKRKDNAEISEIDAQNINKIIVFETVKKEYQEKRYFVEEVEKTSVEILEKTSDKFLIFALITDSHYTINGTWADTKNNLQKLSSLVDFQGIIHLGDCTDGMVPREVTVDYVSDIQKDIMETGKPLYYVLGNHDSNYFYNNPDCFTVDEMAELYLSKQPYNVCRGTKKTYYYADFKEEQIRCIFLESFDYRENIRYGFSDEELNWLESILIEAQLGWDILIFSHVPPIPRLHYWSNEIRGSQRLMQILTRYQNSKKGKILAFIHGHNHADQIDYLEGFPIVSIGCAKCEFFIDKKPEGSITYEREVGTLSQELWDILIISKNKKCLDFIRFGAGENRHVELE